MTAEGPASEKLSVLVLQSGDAWVAMGLEHCIVAQAETLSAVVSAFFRQLSLQLLLDLDAGQSPFADCPPAPAEFWERYQKTGLHLSVDLSVDLPVPEEPRPDLPQVRNFIEDIRIAA